MRYLKYKIRSSIVVLVSLLVAQNVTAQLVSSTGETLVNTTTTDSTQQNCAIAMDTLGRYVVVWESEHEDGDGFGIYAKIYNADHTVRVPDFQINTSEQTNDQRFPDVAINAEGIWCVVWQTQEDEGYNIDFAEWVHQGWDCYRKLFNIDGAAVSSRSRLNSSTTGNQMHPAIAAGDDRFVAVWTSEVAGQNESEIQERYFLSNGANLAATTVVHTSLGNHLTHPDVAMSANGEYVFTWQADGLDGDRKGIYMAVHDDSYALLLGPTLVNTTTAGNQQEPRVAMDENGDFMIVWSSFDQDGDHFGIYGQRFTNGGVANGGEIAITTNTTGSQDHVAIAVSREGGKYIISWTDDVADGDKTGIYSRTMYSNGSFLANDALINTTTANYQNFSDVAIGTDATEAVYAWQSGVNHGSTGQADPSYYGIYNQGFVVEDITPPVAVCQNITAYLDGTGNVSINAVDLDGGSTDNVGITSMTASTTDFDCSNVLLNVVTLTVFDAVGLSNSCVATVNVLDTISPTMVCQNITVYLDGAGAATITSADVDGGSSDNCGAPTMSIDVSAFDCSMTGTNTVTLTGTDASGNSSSCASTVTVLDTISPSAVCQNITVYLDATGSITIAGSDLDGGSTDNCSGSLTFGADITAFTCAEIGTNSVIMTVTDLGGNTSDCTSTVTVLDTISPTVVCQDITVYLDGTGNASIAANDIDGGSTDNCGTPTLGIDVSSFDCSTTGANTVTLTATDASGNSSSCTSTVTILDTISPTAVCQDITVYLDGTGNVSITSTDIDNGSSDNCGTPALSIDISAFDCSMTGSNTVTLTATDASGNISTCASTVTVLDTISPTAVCQDITVYLDGSGNVSIASTDIDNGSTDNCGVPTTSIDLSAFDCSMTGSNTVTLTATDVSGNTSTCTSTVTVLDTILPTAVCQDITVYLDGTGNVSIVPADLDGGSTDNCGVPTMSIDVSAFDCSMTGANTVTVTATDVSGNSSSCTSTVTVLDTISPTAVCQDITVYLDGTGNVSITSADIDNGSTDNCGVPTTSIDVSSFDCSMTGSNTVTLTATDASGNTSTCASTVTVLDTIAPTANTIASANVECIGDLPVTDINIVTGVMDNCTATPTVTWTNDVSDGLSCPETITRTYSVVDASGNSADITQTITVQDITLPTASNPLDISVQCVADIPTEDPTVVTDEADNCNTPTVTWTSDVSDGLSCPETITRTYTVTDDCGNSIDVVQLIVVLDIDAPVADSVQLSEVIGACSVTPPTATATDNCSGQLNGVPDVTFPITTLGTTIVTWTYTDACGNTSSQTQDVTINPVDVSTSIDNDGITLVATNVDAGVTYQWMDCNTGQVVTGETNYNFTPTYGSDFAVIISQNGCIDTSVCVNSTVSIETIDFVSNLDLIIFPNPAFGGEFSVQLQGPWVGEVTVEMIDSRGRLIYTGLTIDKLLNVNLGNVEPGAYFIRAMDEDSNVLTTRLVTVTK